MDFKLAVANEILNALNASFADASLEAAEIASALEIPPDTAMGDYAFPCFRLSKTLRKAPMMIAQNFKPGFRIDLHVKDLNNVVETAEKLGMPIECTDLALSMLKKLQAEGCGSMDHSALVKVSEEAAGLTL